MVNWIKLVQDTPAVTCEQNNGLSGFTDQVCTVVIFQTCVGRSSVQVSTVLLFIMWYFMFFFSSSRMMR
jgi:hypothetical protein